jgi:hypothetical protein
MRIVELCVNDKHPAAFDSIPIAAFQLAKDVVESSTRTTEEKFPALTFLGHAFLSFLHVRLARCWYHDTCFMECGVVEFKGEWQSIHYSKLNCIF